MRGSSCVGEKERAEERAVDAVAERELAVAQRGREAQAERPGWLLARIEQRVPFAGEIHSVPSRERR